MNKCFISLPTALVVVVACKHAEEYDWRGRQRVLTPLYEQARAYFLLEYDLDLVGRSISAFQGPIKRLGVVLEKDADPSIDEAKTCWEVLSKVVDWVKESLPIMGC